MIRRFLACFAAVEADADSFDVGTIAEHGLIICGFTADVGSVYGSGKDKTGWTAQTVREIDLAATLCGR